MFKFQTHEFYLPLVTPEQFTSDGLLIYISRFISDVVACNPNKRARLSPDAIKAAVVKFAIQRFPGAVGLQQQLS